MRAAVLGLFVGLAVVAGCSPGAPVAKATPHESPAPTAFAESSPSPSPSPSPSRNPSPPPTLSPLPPIAGPEAPPPIGTAVAARVLPPASVLPAGSLCSAPLQRYADGNAGPLFCVGGAIVVDTWTYFAPVDPHVLSVGRGATLTAVESAICADGAINHATYPMEQSGYQLAAAYYGCTFAFDIEQFQQYGTCP